MNITAFCFAGFVATLLAAFPLHSADWTQYRGPKVDGSTAENISTQWPKNGPRVIWKAQLGDSFGALSVSGGRVFAFIQRPFNGQDKEVAIALDEKNGREIWAVALGEPTYDNQGGDGPRSTPTVDGNKVYFLGANLKVSCLDAATGKIIWQQDIVKEFSGKVIQWKNAASPVLDGNLIFVNGGGAGQAFLAFDKRDGKVVWKSGNETPTHASPTPATIHGVRQVVFFTKSGLVSCEAFSGKELWRYPFPFRVSTASSPIVFNDIVYCSAGYGVGAGAVRISKNEKDFVAKELWRKESDLMNHWTTPVCKDGYLYGIFGFKDYGRAPLKCVEIATGKEIWSQPGFGSGGGTILVGGDVLAQSDRGPLVLVEASPKAYNELARAQVYAGKCWTMPVVSNGKIFCRNTKEGFCLDVLPQTAQR